MVQRNATHPPTKNAQAELEMNMNSIERADEYCRVPQESPEVIPTYRPPTDRWPDEGEIRVSHLTLRYPSSAKYVSEESGTHLRGNL